MKIYRMSIVRLINELRSVVLVEGREETVNFIPTEFRFCLMMSDTSLIGKRRAAQRILAKACKDYGSGDVADCLKECVKKLAA